MPSSSIIKKINYAITKKGEIATLLGLSGNPTWEQIKEKISEMGDSKISTIIDKSITEVTANDLKDLTSIGSYSFYYCTSLNSVELPNTITSIGESAFNNCTSLTSITLPSSVTTLGTRCFYGSGITSIDLPSGITVIPSGAFQSCNSLTSITINCNQVCSLLYYTAVIKDNYQQNKIKIYVPASLKSSYESASQWSTALSMNAIEFKAIV